MFSHFLHTRPAISWFLLGTMCLPSFPAAAAQASGPRLPVAFNLAMATEPQPVSQPQPGATTKDASAGSGLHLVVLSGKDGVNVLKKRTTVRPVVQVLDGQDHPVAGALVTFTAPASGPGVQFDGGTRTAMVVSDSDGRVTPAGVVPVNAGPFVYRIRAIYQEQEATETLAQTNVPNGSASTDAQTGQTTTGATRDHRVPGWAYAALIGGAAAGVGIGVALGTRQSGRTAATTTSATIGAPGAPTVGAP